MSGLLQRFAVVVCVLMSCQAASADFVINYTVDAGGANSFGISGLSARSTWSVSGNQLLILLENTSTSVPEGFEISDSLLVSLAFDLGNISILSGDTAVIGNGSMGLGIWADLNPGDSVASQWLWTNDFGGDQFLDFTQVISTSMGQGGGLRTNFNGDPADVAGPFGGIAAPGFLLAIPDMQYAVSNSIRFSLTLSDDLSEEQLHSLAHLSQVEFGSDFQYLAVPGPGVLAALLGLPLVVRSRSRRREILK